jgi:hypothetical protein
MQNEAPQTIAFILSFCKSKSYITKVIKLLAEKKCVDSEEFILDILTYLKDKKDSFNPHITHNIEVFCDKTVMKYNSGVELPIFRKNIDLKLII